MTGIIKNLKSVDEEEVFSSSLSSSRKLNLRIERPGVLLNPPETVESTSTSSLVKMNL